MTDVLPIGAFSRAVLLSPKTLRDYHEAGLLTPAVVDPRTGHRGYRRTQLGEAAAIRELRRLDVPLAEIRRVLAARDPAVTRAVLTAHRDRMRAEAERAGRIAATLDDLLSDPAAVTRLAVTERRQPATPTVSLRRRVPAAGFADFLGEAYPRLAGFLADRGVPPAGPPGALYPGDAFTDDPVEVVAYLPVASPPAGGDGVDVGELPAARLAVATHVGPYRDLASAYRAVGAWLAGQDAVIDAPVRETYLVGPGDGVPETRYRTELGWPVRTDEKENV